MRLLFLDCSSALGKSEAEPLKLRYQAEPGNEGFSSSPPLRTLFVEHPNSIRRVLFRRFLTSR